MPIPELARSVSSTHRSSDTGGAGLAREGDVAHRLAAAPATGHSRLCHPGVEARVDPDDELEAVGITAAPLGLAQQLGPSPVQGNFDTPLADDVRMPLVVELPLPEELVALSAGGLEQTLVATEQVRRLVEATLLDVIDVADRRGIFADDGHATVRQWVQTLTNSSGTEAARDRVGRASTAPAGLPPYRSSW